MLLNKFYPMKYMLSLVLSLAFLQTGWAQDDCASAVAVTDLTAAVCATSAPGSTSTIGAGPCEDGTIDTWFTFTAQGTSADITVSNTSNGWRPEYVVASSSDGTCAGTFTAENCLDQNGNYTSITGTTTGLTPGTTYWVIVSSNGNSTAGTISVCVDNPATTGVCVDNQDCASPAAFALNASGGAAACVTDCNTGASVGPDFTGNNCHDLTNATVWYEITTDASAATLDISLTSADLSDPEFTLFETADCSNFTILDCQEGTGGSASATSVAVAPNTTYLIAVSDVTTDEGNFDLCVTQVAAPAGTCLGDDCNTPVPIPLATTATQQCVNGCNTSASPGPDFTGNNCQDLPNATVWYEVTTTALTATMNIDLTSADLSDPEFTVFSTADCATFTTISCVEGSGGSASAALIPVNASQTYLIAVSDATADEGNFQLCVQFDEDQSACNVDNTLQVTGTSLGSPLTGPFQPGEVVDFCYTINSYVTSTTNCNYLQGIVPSFGDCWDPVSFDAQGMPSSITTALTTIGQIGNVVAGNDPCENSPSGTWDWFPAGSVDYNLASTNPMGYTTGDDVGAGWFFVSSYDAVLAELGFWGCPNGSPDPNDSYGDNDFPACNDLGGWQVCFQLQVKDATACGTGETDCAVTMKTFADGEIGVWQNIGCTADQPTNVPATLTCVLLSTDIEAFLGQNEGDYNRLEWMLSDASVVKEFQLEKSIDAVNWEPLATIEGRDPQLNYSFEDQAPFKIVSYYRFKVVDHADNWTYSNVISIANNNNPNTGLISNIYPNPTKDRFFFNYTGNDMDTPVKVQVVDMIGQLIEAYEVNLTDPNELFEVNTIRYNEGVYFVNIIQGPLKMVKRISVMR